MTFKINIGEKSGKTYKLEADAPGLIEKKLGETIQGKDIREDLTDYEFEITGASDKSGFPSIKEVQGENRKKVLLKYGKGMHKRTKKEGKKKVSNPTPKGLRLRKTVRGEIISENIVQINLKVTKEGKKPLADIFKPAEASTETPEETKK